MGRTTGDQLRSALRARDKPTLEARTALSTVLQNLLGTEEAAPQVGRYRLEGRLGEGGCGIVFRARDPRLDREVAIKLLRLDAGESLQERAATRLLREAEAIARLSHENVVQVFDVGSYTLPADVNQPGIPRQGLFVVMELVEGTDLRGWLKASKRTTTQILEVFAAAGRGLAAAHGAGLVHRDVKPGNVLVGDDGRVKVADFGLVRALDAAPSHESGQPSQPSDRSDEGLTRTGAVVGTPLYMSPEQHGSARVDARADQYGFCVALYEALSGTGPFRGSSVQELVRAKQTLDLSGGQALSRRVRAALVRGMQPKAADRFDSMDALLAALAGRPGRARPWLVAAGLVGVAGVLAVPALADHDQCDAATRLREVWDPVREARARDAFAGSDVARADELWVRIRSRFATTAGEWSQAHAQACRDDERAQTAESARRLACLAQQRAALRATASVLEHADSRVVRGAVTLLKGLPDVERCSDEAWLGDGVLPPDDPALRARVEAVRVQLAQATATYFIGDHQGSLAQAESALADAERLGYAPLVVEALERAGALALILQEFEKSRERLEQAYFEAKTLGHAPVAAGAAILLHVLAAIEQRLEDAATWRAHAQAEVDALDAPALRFRLLLFGGRSDLRRLKAQEAKVQLEAAVALARDQWSETDARYVEAQVLLASSYAHLRRDERALELYAQAVETARGLIGSEVLLASAEAGLAAQRGRMGELQESIRLLEASVERTERTLGPDALELGDRFGSLGIAYRRAKRYDDSQRSIARALDVYRRRLGEEHSVVAAMLGQLGSTAKARGRYDAAADHYRAALELEERVSGLKHPLVAERVESLANALVNAGAFDDAIPMYERALSIRAEAFGTDSRKYGLALSNLSGALRLTGEVARARELATRAVELQERALGPDHERVAYPLYQLAAAELLAGDATAALEHHRRGLEIRRANLDARSPMLAYSLHGTGEALVALGRVAQGREHLDEALDIRLDLGTDHPFVADSLQALGELDLAAGDLASARARLRRAYEIRSTRTVPAPKLERTRTALARAGVSVP